MKYVKYTFLRRSRDAKGLYEIGGFEIEMVLTTTILTVDGYFCYSRSIVHNDRLV
jgi:hypothetical protein